MQCISLVLALSLTGCSFFLTRGPGDAGNPPRAYPADCTDSMTWPITDGVLTGLMVAALIGGLNENTSMETEEDRDTRVQAISSLVILSAVAGVSTYVGYSRVSKCRASREQFQAAYPGGSQSYGYPPQGHPPQGYPPPQGHPPPGYPPPGYPPPASRPQPQSPEQPQPTSGPSVPGTEGDVCASDGECASELTCSANACVRPARK